MANQSSILLSFLLSLALLLTIGQVSALPMNDAHENYIVYMRDDIVSAAVLPETPSSIVKRSVGDDGIVKSWSFRRDNQPNAFLVKANSVAAENLRSDSRVQHMVRDSVVTAYSTEVQTDVSGWGLDVIDSTDFSLDEMYTYDEKAGSDVVVYVVDSGINTTLADFEGRASWGTSFVEDDNQNAVMEDDYGHGTHVAGIIGSRTYGVAKNVTLVAVKVLDSSGTSSISTLISALEWVVANKDSSKTNIINLSLGTNKNDAMDAAVKGCFDNGVPVVVAVGNNGADACNYSPSASPYALRVGAINVDGTYASYSNTGSCVDISAPGTNIISLNYEDGSKRILSGTSQATPFVTGALALLYSTQQFDSITDAYTTLRNKANNNIIDLPVQTANYNLYTGTIRSST